MNIYHTREKLRTRSIYDLNLRVAFYARVSTDSEDQQVSIEHQTQYYKEFIKSNRNWKFAKGYIDNGISGIQTKHREQFKEMLEDAKNGKFDMLITKEITRFARNTLDSIQYTRQMLSWGVCVWFQNDNINTIDEDSELRLTIMAGVAQDEVRKLSNRVKFGHKQSIKNGVVLGNSRIYGYDKKDGKLTINESEAQMVKMIFEDYASGEWTTPQLEKKLYNMGYRNYKGGKIDRNVIRHIIRNPKYKGYYAGGKVKIVDMFTKKQEFLPESEWVMFKDDGSHVPQIVDEEVWKKANEYIDARGEIVKTSRTSIKKSENVFTGMLICGNDGASYWLKQRTLRGKEDVKWVCSKKIKEGAASCDSFYIDDRELREVIAKLIRESSGDIEQIAEKFIKIYHSSMNQADASTEIKRLEKQINVAERKSDKLLEYNLDGAISDAVFIEKSQKLEAQIEEYKKQIEKLSTIQDDIVPIENQIRAIAHSVKQLDGISPDDITKTVVDSFLKKIVVNPIGEKEAKLVFYLKDGITTEMSFVSGKSMRCSVNLFNPIFTERSTTFYRALRSFPGHKEPVKYTYFFAF